MIAAVMDGRADPAFVLNDVPVDERLAVRGIQERDVGGSIAAAAGLRGMVGDNLEYLEPSLRQIAQKLIGQKSGRP